MSNGKDYLHSHSALEREIKLPNRFVLVDLKYSDMFNPKTAVEFKVHHDGHMLMFLKVPTIEFVNNGGVFKNLML